MMINCKESAIRSSELRDRRIGGIRKLELWYHLMICRFCRIYNKQIKKLGRLSRLMGDTSRVFADTGEEPTEVCLSEDAKARIKKNITSTS